MYPGTFTVSWVSEEQLFGPTKSDDGSFQADKAKICNSYTWMGVQLFKIIIAGDLGGIMRYRHFRGGCTLGSQIPKRLAMRAHKIVNI